MRRLLQFGTFFLVLVTFFVPLAECFDRWDPPGISNDTEFAVFALIFILCLVLLVSKLISALASLVSLVPSPNFQTSEKPSVFGAHRTLQILVPPLDSSPPLRV
jgi:Na+/phosphate symporter